MPAHKEIVSLLISHHDRIIIGISGTAASKIATPIAMVPRFSRSASSWGEATLGEQNFFAFFFLHAFLHVLHAEGPSSDPS